MSIVRARAAIVAALRTALPRVDIKEHPRATLTTKDMHDAVKARGNLAIRVAFAGAHEDVELDSNTVDVPCQWVAYILSADQTGKSAQTRDVIALNVVPRIARTIHQRSQDVPELQGQIERMRIIPGPQGEEDESARSVMIWTVQWRQTLSFEEELEESDLLPFLELVTSYDLAPGDGAYEATDTIQLPQSDD